MGFYFTVKIINFDLNTLHVVRKYWIDSANTLSGLSDDSMELTEQLFDFVEQGQLFGQYSDRENLNTFVGVDIDEDGSVDALVEVIYSRRARVKTIKIMDIYYSPTIEAKDDKEYDKACVDVLKFIVDEFLTATSDSVGGSTKIYARTDVSLDFLNQLHEAIQHTQEKLEDVGLEVKLEGKRWLALRFK